MRVKPRPNVLSAKREYLATKFWMRASQAGHALASALTAELSVLVLTLVHLGLNTSTAPENFPRHYYRSVYKNFELFFQNNLSSLLAEVEISPHGEISDGHMSWEKMYDNQ